MQAIVTARWPLPQGPDYCCRKLAIIAWNQPMSLNACHRHWKLVLSQDAPQCQGAGHWHLKLWTIRGRWQLWQENGQFYRKLATVTGHFQLSDEESCNHRNRITATENQTLSREAGSCLLLKDASQCHRMLDPVTGSWPLFKEAGQWNMIWSLPISQEVSHCHRNVVSQNTIKSTCCQHMKCFHYGYPWGLKVLFWQDWFNIFTM